LFKVHKVRYFPANRKSMSGLHIFVSAALLLSAFKDLSRLYTTDFLTPFYNSLFIYYNTNAAIVEPSVVGC